MKIFISYAREDIETARKLYYDLKQAGISPWMDKEDIMIGENWKVAIRQAMKESSYFLALLSSNSLSKQGYVQKELKMALDILAEMPPSGIFLLPVRLDDCNPLDERLQDINWGNLFPSYEEGLSQILRVLKKNMPEEPPQPVQPIRQPDKPKIPTWLTVIVLSAMIVAGIMKFYPSEKQTKSDSSLKTADLIPISKTDPPPKPPDKEFTNSLGMKFVRIPAGTFMMGSPPDDPQREEDENQHKVTISKSFYMQTTEVTQGQWKAVMGEYPPELYFKNCGDNCPVERVSWDDIQGFIKALNKREKTDRYRLPTEAEWEYAARAGTTTPFAFGKCLSADQANYDGNNPPEGCSKGKYREKTVPAGSFAPNAWGLYDMHGNVYEWVQDIYDKSAIYTDEQTDPICTLHCHNMSFSEVLKLKSK